MLAQRDVAGLVNALLEADSAFYRDLGPSPENAAAPLIKHGAAMRKSYTDYMRAVPIIVATVSLACADGKGAAPALQAIAEKFVFFLPRRLCGMLRLPVSRHGCLGLELVQSWMGDPATPIRMGMQFTLQDQLAIPMQRLLKIPLLLKDLIRHTPATHSEADLLPQALALIDAM